MEIYMETIAALSTAPFRSGVAVIRISGDKALEIAEKVFISSTGRRMKPREMTLGELKNTAGETLDRILAVRFKKPNSFTGEDVVELHCHGSTAVINSALTALFVAGARQALPGEFTKRAFLNNRLDLTQAEAVGELIAAETEQIALNAAAQIGGSLTKSIDGIYNALIGVLAHFHAVVDYPDEDIDELRAEDILSELKSQEEKMDRLIENGQRGRTAKEGIVCTIIGRPNVGKSSLMNMLSGYDRAIVTPTAGTTRDIIETDVVLGGIPIRLQDTAGLRQAENEIEKIGVDLAKNAAKNAAVIFWVIDGSEPVSEDDFAILENLGEKPVIALINKSDLGQRVDIEKILESVDSALIVSAKEGTGFEKLDEKIREIAGTGGLTFDGSIITNARQLGLCMSARENIINAARLTGDGYPPDMALYEVEDACGRLSELIGKKVSDDIVDRIFSDFCVGK